MYSCLHCEVVSSNRNSFNRHLREHLGTDVEFLRNKISEEDHQKTLEEKEEAPLENVEQEETGEMDTDLHDVGQETGPDVTDNSIGQETFSEDTDEDINSILERYQHIDGDNMGEDVDDSDLHGDQNVEISEESMKLDESTYHKYSKIVEHKATQLSLRTHSPVIEDLGEESEINQEEKKNESEDCLEELDEKASDSKDRIAMEIEKKFRKKTKSKTEKTKGGKSFFCSECGAGFTQKGGMNSHHKSIHQGFKYPCNQCDFQATQRGNLWTHMKKMHDGIKPKSPINTGKKSVKYIQKNVGKSVGKKIPKKMKSDDVMSFDCPDCDSKYITRAGVMRHYKAVHQGLRHPCTQCDYQFTLKENLVRHTKNKHIGA